MKLFKMAIVLAVVAATGQPVAGDSRKTESVEKEFELAAGGRMNLSHVSGKIEIRGDKVRKATVRASKHGKTQEDLDRVEIKMEGNGKLLTLITAYGKESAWEKLKHLFSKGLSADVKVDYTILLPNDVAIEASTVSGDIDVSDTNAALKLNGVSGDAKIRRARGGVTVSTVSGKVWAEDIAGGLEVNTVSGDLKAREIQGGDLNVSTTSGEVKLEFEENAYRGGRIQSVSGDVTVDLPRGTDANIELSSISGELEVDKKLSSSFAKGDKKLTLGKGGPELNVGTVSGDLEIDVAGH